jgi:hypothetical protein
MDNSSSHSSDEADYRAPSWIYFSSGIALSIIGIFGVSFNLMAIIVFAKDKSVGEE